MKERMYKKAVKFVSFSFIGTTTFAVQLFFTVMFTELIHMTYYTSHAFALLMAWTLNFFCNLRLTFKTEDMVRKRLLRFAGLAVGNTIINWALVFIVVERLVVHYFLAIIGVSLVLSVLMFVGEELWVFARQRVRRAASASSSART